MGRLEMVYKEMLLREAGRNTLFHNHQTTFLLSRNQENADLILKNSISPLFS